MTSAGYPPATGHERPLRAGVWVWCDLAITYPRYAARRGRHPWRWCCTHCDPPASGFRSSPGAWELIMTVSLPRHFAAVHGVATAHTRVLTCLTVSGDVATQGLREDPR